MKIPNAALKWIEEHTRRAVRQGSFLDEHWEANFFLSGGSQPSARIQRYSSFLTKKADIKSWCTLPASPKTAALTAMVPRAGKHFQNYTDALSKATQSTLSVRA